MELFLRILHALAAAVWVGGGVALVVVAVPPARRLEGEARALLLQQFGRRWRRLGWGAMGVLVATGVASAAEHGAFRAETFRTDFGALLVAKVVLAAALVAAAAAHDFVLGPRLAREIAEGRPQRTRPRLVLVGWTSLALTIAVPVLGVVLAGLAHGWAQDQFRSIP